MPVNIGIEKGFVMAGYKIGIEIILLHSNSNISRGVLNGHLIYDTLLLKVTADTAVRVHKCN